MKLIYPFDGTFPVTQCFGEKITDPKGHSGIDYALYTGTPVRAAAAGTVRLAQRSESGYGNHIILRHDGNMQTVYAHLDTLLVTAGQEVACGQVIGTSGNSGNSTGPHLHFEVRTGRTPRAVDPQPFLDEVDEANAVSESDAANTTETVNAAEPTPAPVPAPAPPTPTPAPPAQANAPEVSSGNVGARNWRVRCPLLHVRSGPGIGYPVCDRLPEGAIVQELEQMADLWVRIGPNRWAAARFDGSNLMEG